MPTQFFKVTRAPEAGETTAQEIKHALMDVRDDTEWDVKEFRQFESKFSSKKEVYELYKDGRFIAAWDQGDPERDGGTMNRETLEREFKACVAYWRSRGSKATFEMRIRRFDATPKKQGEV